MNCAQLRVKISPYLDSELSYSDLTAFKGHLAGCANCTELVTEMSGIKIALHESIDASLPPDFVTRLQHRLRAEVNRPQSPWRKLIEPRIGGFSPLSVGGLAAAALALAIIGVSLFTVESAPIVAPPTSSAQQASPPLINPLRPIPTSATSPVLTTAPGDSSRILRDSSRRDFSRQIKLVNTGDRP